MSPHRLVKIKTSDFNLFIIGCSTFQGKGGILSGLSINGLCMDNVFRKSQKTGYILEGFAFIIPQEGGDVDLATVVGKELGKGVHVGIELTFVDTNHIISTANLPTCQTAFE